jgi:PIN domain nuclease of toxin-antitoxin system
MCCFGGGDTPHLSPHIRAAIEDIRNTVMISAVTIWEIAVKRSLGKLDIPEDWFDAICDESFEHLSITFEHARKVDVLPNFHRDPFDRILIAQALSEGLTLVTHDDIMLKYDVPYLKA